MLLTGAGLLKQQNSVGEYERLVVESSSITEGPLMQFYDIIDKDLDRTYPHHTHFKRQAASGQVPHATCAGGSPTTHRQTCGRCCGRTGCATLRWGTRRGWVWWRACCSCT